MRLPEEDFQALQAMSLLTGKKMAELVRDAIVDKLIKFARSGDMQNRIEAEARLRRDAAAKLEDRAAGTR
jgi:ribosomal protein L17